MTRMPSIGTSEMAFSTAELAGKRVFGGKKNRRIGKVRRFVFHPSSKRCVGFIVKRPDAALMFRRKDIFVALDRFSFDEDGNIVISEEKASTDQAACDRLGVEWSRCVLWQGMPLVTEDDERIGFVGTVVFSVPSGRVEKLVVDTGQTAKALLGTKEIDASMIKGFRKGIGDELAVEDDAADFEGESGFGAILVSDEVLSVREEGGLAEKAGKATAVAADKAARAKAKAKPKVDDAAHKTEEAVNKGAFLMGEQIAKSKNMFSQFKDQYDKALKGDGASEDDDR